MLQHGKVDHEQRLNRNVQLATWSARAKERERERGRGMSDVVWHVPRIEVCSNNLSGLPISASR